MTAADKTTTKLIFRDFAACVRVNGEFTTLYEPEYDEATKTATAWIASEPGKEYSIYYRRMKDVGSDALGDLYLDGGSECSTGMFSHRDRPLSKWTSFIGQRVSGQKRRRFTFAELQPTDDPNLLVNPCAAKDPGQIELRIKRIVITSTQILKPGKAHKPIRPTTTSSTYVHEKTKKLGCHITDLGAEYDKPTRTRRKWRLFSESDTGHYVKFVFKYRSADMLQAMGVITNAARHQRSSEEVDEVPHDEGGDDSDLERHEAKIAALEVALKGHREAIAAKRKVKREAEDAPSGSKRQRVKKEHSPIVLPDLSPEVIDLTSD